VAGSLPIAASHATFPKRTPLSAAERRRLSRGPRLRRISIALAFLAPNLVFFVIFLVGPLVQTFLLSFRGGGITSSLPFVGLKNWQNIETDALAVAALGNSVRFAILAIPLTLALSLGLGLFLRNLKRGAGLFRALIYAPVLAPVVIAGLMWLFLVNPDFGLFNLILRSAGMPGQIWLADPTLAQLVVVALEVWRGVAFWSLFFLAALIGLPAELYAAAQADGATSWQRFRFITMPLLKRAILFALVVATISNLQIFDAVYVMTDGGPFNSTVTVVWYIYKTLFAFSRIGYGAALSFILLVVILALTLIEMRLLRVRRTG
jgi:ABC-type sugar transport system permease subunit